MRREAKAAVVPIRQTTQFNCMATSACICIKANGIDCTTEEVNKVMGAKPMQGASWEDAAACAQHYGMRATLVMPCTVGQLKEWTDRGVPVMIAWNPEGRDWSHASVVFDVDDEGQIHIADPNMPNPSKVVRVVTEDDFYGKWSEKYPRYLVRRPAMAIEREITSEGRQVMARKQANNKQSAGRERALGDDWKRHQRRKRDDAAEDRTWSKLLREGFRWGVYDWLKGYAVLQGGDDPLLMSLPVLWGKQRAKTHRSFLGLLKRMGVPQQHVKDLVLGADQLVREGARPDALDVLGEPFHSAYKVSGRWSKPAQVVSKPSAAPKSPAAPKTVTDSATAEKLQILNTLAEKVSGWPEGLAHAEAMIKTYESGRTPSSDDLKKTRNFLYRNRMRNEANHFRQASVEAQKQKSKKKKKRNRKTQLKPQEEESKERNPFVPAMRERGGKGPHGTKSRKQQRREKKQKGYDREAGADKPYSGNPDGKPIFPNEIDHGYDEPLGGGWDVMRRMQNQFRHEKGQDTRPDSKRLATLDEWEKLAMVDEALMERAVGILEYVPNTRDAVKHLIDEGHSKSDAYLAIKAGEHLRTKRKQRREPKASNDAWQNLALYAPQPPVAPNGPGLIQPCRAEGAVDPDAAGAFWWLAQDQAEVWRNHYFTTRLVMAPNAGNTFILVPPDEVGKWGANGFQVVSQPQNPRLAEQRNTTMGISDSFDRLVRLAAKGDDKEAMNAKGKPVDPDEMEKQAPGWKSNTDKHKDKFKKNKAAGDDYDASLEMLSRLAGEEDEPEGGDEKEGKFEKGKPADPTKNMSPEQKAEWNKQKEEHKDKFKAACSCQGDASPCTCENTRQRLTAGPSVDLWAAVTEDGALLGATDSRGGSGYRYWRSFDPNDFDIVKLNRVPIDLAEQLVDVGTSANVLSDGYTAWQQAMRYEAGGYRSASKLEEQWGRMISARAPGGLYGYTKKIQGDCEASIRKLGRSAGKIARAAYAKDERVAPFLAMHAKRGKKTAARILVAAMKEMGPKVAAQLDSKVAYGEAPSGLTRDEEHLWEELYLVASNDGRSYQKGDAAGAVNTAWRDLRKRQLGDWMHDWRTISKAMIPLLQSWMEDTETTDGTAPRNLDPDQEQMWDGIWLIAENDGASYRKKDAKGAAQKAFREWYSWRRQDEQETFKSFSRKLISDLAADWGESKMASGGKTASYGMYGYRSKTASLGINACAQIREVAGQIASNLHRRRAKQHEKITGFLGAHQKKGRCMYARMLRSYYPDSDMHLASAISEKTPGTVDEWLSWKE